ncbi:MAG: GNAT family N-acetyltransferase [Anaerolineales bacterium]|nr:GNAT family N-acetyltransferase [Anaerolineales bacterium]
MTRHLYHLTLTEYTPSPSPLFPSSPYRLRTPTPTDLPALAALMIVSYTGTIDYDGETLEDATNEVQSYFNGASGETLLDSSWLCFDCEALASAILISLWEGQPLVAYVMTATAYKGQGLGRALLERSLTHLKNQGKTEVRAVITEGNLPSKTIFKAMGFQLIPPHITP